jgi:hypothetical protein
VFTGQKPAKHKEFKTWSATMFGIPFLPGKKVDCWLTKSPVSFFSFPKFSETQTSFCVVHGSRLLPGRGLK